MSMDSWSKDFLLDRVRCIAALRGARCSLAVACAALWALAAAAQEPAKSGDARQEPPASVIGAKADTASAGAKEVLTFKQQSVAAETAELEERMFRLSEALKKLEPENASRLLLALKFAREEFIRHQMAEAEQLLAKARLNEAVDEQKQLLAKLERLHNLLLSTDLDFQMKLERLRQMRDLVRRLETAIGEEDRQVAQSQLAARKQEELAGLRKRRATLTELIERQSRHVAETKKLSEAKDLGEAEKGYLAQLAKDQARTERDTRFLAGDAGAESKLGEAADRMQNAAEALRSELPADALPLAQQALAALESETKRHDAELARLEKELDAARFAAQRQDQAANRGLTGSIAESARGLGDSGAKALAELLRAGGNMSSAEEALQLLKADRAGAHQQQALESLQFARRDLQNEIQRLLDELSGEVRGRVIDTLKRMLEQQTAVREQTQSLGPKAAEGSRQAVASIVALAEREGKIIALADEIITLVEETEFGVALPAALRAVRDEMSSVQSRLKEADASDAVVALQKQIEEDLSALLDAMKRMLSTRKPQSSDPGNLQVRERELNRLVAELKMVRLLQLRVNKETVGVDGKRPMPPAEVPAGVKQEISGVEKRQDAVRSTTEKLSERLEP